MRQLLNSLQRPLPQSLQPLPHLLRPLLQHPRDLLPILPNPLPRLNQRQHKQMLRHTPDKELGYMPHEKLDELVDLIPCLLHPIQRFRMLDFPPPVSAAPTGREILDNLLVSVTRSKTQRQLPIGRYSGIVGSALEE